MDDPTDRPPATWTPADRSVFLDTLTPGEARQMLLDVAEAVPLVFGHAVDRVTQARAALAATVTPCPDWCPHRRTPHPSNLHWRDLGTLPGRGVIVSLVVLREAGHDPAVRLFVEDDQGIRFHDLAPGVAAALGHAVTSLDPAGVREFGQALTTGSGLLLMDRS